MEPILKHPQFTSLLKVWKFVTTYHDYLQLPEAVGLMSLYQFDEHIRSQKFMTTFVSQLIEALVRKVAESHKNNKHQTVLMLARNNKFGLLDDLLKTSAYALGHSEVNNILVWRNHQQIDPTKPFEALPISEKYRYLSWLVSFVNVSNEFKHDYMQNLKKQNAEAFQQAGRKKNEIYQTFGMKLASSYILGKNSSEKSYVYIPKIGDSILCFDMKKNEWTQIIGHQNVNKQILQKLIKKSSSLTNEEIDLLQSISQIWAKPGWKIAHSAFDKINKQFNINEPPYVQNKLEKIKLKMHELDENYSKFISDCFNFRWAGKQRRLQFHKQIDDAKDMKDLVICLGDFFSETKNSIQRKINTLDFYDYSLDSKDVEPQEFKQFYLKSNYIYSKGVIAVGEKLQIYAVNLYSHIKSFLAEPDSFQHYFYEYLTIFVGCMLGVIQQMYPGQYKKRLKNLERLEDVKEQSKKRENLLGAKKHPKGIFTKLTHTNSEQSSSGQSQSQTTAEQNKKNQAPSLHRRLRQKMRINYRPSNSRSQSIAKKARTQQQRNVKSKKSKMKLDSDSDEEVDLSLSESDTEKDKGLNLDGYKYVDEDETNKFRRNLRNSRT